MPTFTTISPEPYMDITKSKQLAQQLVDAINAVQELKKVFLKTRRDTDPNHWEFHVGYFERGGLPPNDDTGWIVLAVSTEDRNGEPGKQNGVGVILTGDDFSRSGGTVSQDRNGIWMWNTD